MECLWLVHREFSWIIIRLPSIIWKWLLIFYCAGSKSAGWTWLNCAGSVSHGEVPESRPEYKRQPQDGGPKMLAPYGCPPKRRVAKGCLARPEVNDQWLLLASDIRGWWSWLGSSVGRCALGFAYEESKSALNRTVHIQKLILENAREILCAGF